MTRPMSVKQEFERWYKDWISGQPWDPWRDENQERMHVAYIAGRRAGLRAADKRGEENVKQMSRQMEGHRD